MGRNWAIAIGINHYENLRSLNFAKRDASVMATWFQQEARFDQVFLFTDDSPPIAANPSIPTQPTYGHLRRFLRAQFEDIQSPLLKPEDNLWFFFADHGNRLVYILAFGFGLGGSIKPGVGISGDYKSYLEFILPGMVALSSMTVSFVGTTFSICGDRLFTKSFEELLLVPVHPLALHIGKMLAGVMRGLLTSLGVILVALLFTGNWRFLHPLFLLLLVLSCAVFSGLGVIVGLSVRSRSLEAVGLYNNFIIIPMSFLGGTFFDPSTLPAALKVVVYLLPLTYATLGLRAAAYLPLSQFPWYSIPILLVMAIALSLWGGYIFAHQQD